jgi:hypothetical protein
MKYAPVRFVSGFIAVLFIPWALLLFAYDARYYNPLIRDIFINNMLRDGIALLFGIYCLIRFRYWHKRALLRKKQDKENALAGKQPGAPTS